jgi:lipoate-protein ligase A
MGEQKFSLREDDYVFADRKFGGNAQSISKDRWLHHTSFLWDFDPRNMEYLTNPARQPKYRDQRSHTEFLCTLKDVLDQQQAASQDAFAQQLHAELDSHFTVRDVDLSEVLPLLEAEHRKSTRFLDL